jgi:hypothetical protein
MAERSVYFLESKQELSKTSQFCEGSADELLESRVARCGTLATAGQIFAPIVAVNYLRALTHPIGHTRSPTTMPRAVNIPWLNPGGRVFQLITHPGF